MAIRYHKMTTQSQEPPKVRLYDLSGPKPWSPACWNTRYALNYKGIPFETVHVSFPNIVPTNQKLLGSTPREDDTVPILEILSPEYKVLNESTEIAHLLESTFPPEKGYKPLKDLDKVKQYIKDRKDLIRWIFCWVAHDAYENCLDRSDGSREFFKEKTRVKSGGYRLEDLSAVKGGEVVVMEGIRERWEGLRLRMEGDDGSGERTY